MTTYVHCAFAKIKNGKSEKAYLFSVGREEQIMSGSEVCCDTRFGEKVGITVGDSFCVSKEALECICVAVGASLPLRDIIGIVERKVVETEYTTYFDAFLPY